MTRYMISMLIFIALACPLAASSRPAPPSAVPVSYTIYLKNGGKLVIGRYWRRGNTLMFPLYGGTVGIDTEAVGRIVEMTYKVKGTSHVQGDRAK